MVRVAAIIPTYNRAALLSRAIESTLAQSFPVSEVIVVDDGSTDNTRSMIEKFGSDVTYVFQENAGASAARNTGVATAASEWLAFLDSDDVWMPDYLERVAAAIEATQGEALVYFADLFEQASGRTLWERGAFSIDASHAFRRDATDWFMLSVQPTSTQASVIRKDAYVLLGGQPALASREDTHLFFLLGLSGPACAVAGIGAVLADDAQEGSRLTQAHDPASRSYCEQTIWLYRDIVDRFPRLPHRHRAELRRRLAAAYWHRAKLEWTHQRFLRCAASVAKSSVASPTVPMKRLKNGLIRESMHRSGEEAHVSRAARQVSSQVAGGHRSPGSHGSGRDSLSSLGSSDQP